MRNKLDNYENMHLPQIYGEVATKEATINNMINEVIELIEDYRDNIDMYSSIFDENQKVILNKLLQYPKDRNKIKEILKDD